VLDFLGCSKEVSFPKSDCYFLLSFPGTATEYSSAAGYMSSSVFWDITQSMLVKQRRFGARDCPETLVRNQPTPRNNPEDGRIRIATCFLRIVPKAENQKSSRKNRWAAPHQHRQDVVTFALLTIYFTAFNILY
jgi:hypothetical protein